MPSPGVAFVVLARRSGRHAPPRPVACPRPGTTAVRDADARRADMSSACSASAPSRPEFDGFLRTEMLPDVRRSARAPRRPHRPSRPGIGRRPDRGDRLGDRAAMIAAVGETLEASTFHPERLAETTDRTLEILDLRDRPALRRGGATDAAAPVPGRPSVRASSMTYVDRGAGGHAGRRRGRPRAVRASISRPTRPTASSPCRCGRPGRPSSSRRAATSTARRRPRTRAGWSGMDVAHYESCVDAG